MFGAIWNVLSAMLLLMALTLFFTGFVLAPLIILAVGYVIFTFVAPD